MGSHRQSIRRELGTYENFIFIFDSSPCLALRAATPKKLYNFNDLECAISFTIDWARVCHTFRGMTLPRGSHGVPTRALIRAEH